MVFRLNFRFVKIFSYIKDNYLKYERKSINYKLNRATFRFGARLLQRYIIYEKYLVHFIKFEKPSIKDFKTFQRLNWFSWSSTLVFFLLQTPCPLIWYQTYMISCMVCHLLSLPVRSIISLYEHGLKFFVQR